MCVVRRLLIDRSVLQREPLALLASRATTHGAKKGENIMEKTKE